MAQHGILPTERLIHELEVESVAYGAGKHFGLNELSNPNDAAFHGATAELLMGHMDRIRNTAMDIINVLELELDEEI